GLGDALEWKHLIEHRPELARIDQLRDGAQSATIQLREYPGVPAAKRRLRRNALRQQALARLQACLQTELIDELELRRHDAHIVRTSVDLQCIEQHLLGIERRIEGDTEVAKPTAQVLLRVVD